MTAVFQKGERLRHIGHLDIQRAVQRSLRRSGLPVGYSNGFNPHILVTFASALSTGASGSREIMDVTLREVVSCETFMARMNAALPPDLQISSCRAVDDRHPALMAQVTAADYTITIADARAAEVMTGAVEGFLQQEHIMAMRKTKSGMKECDCRPLIRSLAADGNRLHAVLTLTERESCKPDMLIAALSTFAGIEAPRVLVHRDQLFGTAADGSLAPLETL